MKGASREGQLQHWDRNKKNMLGSESDMFKGWKIRDSLDIVPLWKSGDKKGLCMCVCVWGWGLWGREGSGLWNCQ